MKPICKINEFGDKIWTLNSYLHREDGPAVEYANGYKEWYIKGKLHREDGPAIEYFNGHKVWYLHSELHRQDGPAIEYLNGDKVWYYQGKKINCKDNEEFLRIIKLMVFL